MEPTEATTNETYEQPTDESYQHTEESYQPMEFGANPDQPVETPAEFQTEVLAMEIPAQIPVVEEDNELTYVDCRL